MMFLTVQLAAQSRGLLIGNQWMRMNSGGNQFEVFALPAAQGNNPDLYTGQIAENSQFVQLTTDGQLLFFIVDGSVYNKEGERITEACDDYCLYPGKTQILAAPVPGQCNMYYLLSVVPDGEYDLATPMFQVLLLDMDAVNEDGSGCASRGAIVPWLNMDLSDPHSPYHVFEDFVDNGNYIPYTDVLVGLPGATTNVKAKRITMSLYDPGWNDGTLLYHIVTSHHVFQYRLGPGGITFGWRYTYDSGTIAGEEAWSHDAAFGFSSADQELRFAWTHCEDGGLVDQEIGIGQGFPVTVTMLRMDPTDGDLLDDPAWGYNPGNDPICGAKILGCAFTPDGQGMLFTRSAGSGMALGHMNIANGAVTDIGDLLTINQPAQYTTTHIERGTMPNGAGDTYFYGHANGVAMLQYNAILANSTWNAQMPATATLTPPQAAANQAYLPPFLLNAGILGTAHAALQASQACCQSRAMALAWNGNYAWQVENTYQTAWQPDNNPFGGAAEVLFCDDVVFLEDSRISIRDMELHFVEGARLIVEKGARGHVFDSHLTGSCDLSWAGVRVEGVKNHLSQTDLVQGHFSMQGSELSNAQVGIWCARQYSNGGVDPQGYGGHVLLQNSTFRNNRIGLRLEHYRRYSMGVELNNRSRVLNNTFTYDSENPHNAPLQFHALLREVAGVQFLNCDLRNDAHTGWPFTQRGVGIQANNATFRCEGGQNYQDHGFRNLTRGVVVSQPDPGRHYVVDGVAFENNYVGLYDMGSVGAQITNNAFTTLDAGDLGGTTSVGLTLWTSELYTVERNLFKGGDPEVPSTGIWFIGHAQEQNRIYDNTFEDLDAGCVVQGVHVGQSPLPANTKPGLQLLCGDHTGNVVDQLMMENAYIRHNQGKPGFIETLAGNRFFSEPDCTDEFHVWVDPLHPDDLDAMNIHYFHHDPAESPECRPECVDGTWIEDHYTLVSPQGVGGIEFNKEVHCNTGVLDLQSGGNIAQLSAAYEERLLLLTEVVNTYRGTVDHDAKADLLLAIGSTNPLHPSHYLRDMLLGHSPLSDAVLQAAIERPTPMDPWHLTQVLLENSPLTQGVAQRLENAQVLNSFFMGLLHQHQHGMSARQVMEMEIVLRGEEKTFAQRLLLDAWAEDTVTIGKPAALEAIFLADSIHEGLAHRYRLALSVRDRTAEEDLALELNGRHGYDGLLALGSIWMDVPEPWEMASPAQEDDLWNIALGEDDAGGAMAWAALLSMGLTDSLPELVLPQAFRAAYFPRPARRVDPQPLQLMAYPNPARDVVQFTYPAGFEEGRLEFFDSQGRLLHATNLAGQKGFKQVDVQGWSEGLYLVRLVFQGMAVCDTKLTVVR